MEDQRAAHDITFKENISLRARVAELEALTRDQTLEATNLRSHANDTIRVAAETRAALRDLVPRLERRVLSCVVCRVLGSTTTPLKMQIDMRRNPPGHKDCGSCKKDIKTLAAVRKMLGEAPEGDPS